MIVSNRTKGSRLGERGVALVELALALPALMMLLVGLIEFGRLAYFTIEVGNAAHAGAQYGSLSPTNTMAGMQEAALGDGQNTIDPAMTATAQSVCTCWSVSTQSESPSPPTPSACSLPCSSGGYRVTYAQVTVTGTINTLFNYGALGLPSSWTVSRTARMRVAL